MPKPPAQRDIDGIKDVSNGWIGDPLMPPGGSEDDSQENFPQKIALNTPTLAGFFTPLPGYFGVYPPC